MTERPELKRHPHPDADVHGGDVVYFTQVTDDHHSTLVQSALRSVVPGTDVDGLDLAPLSQPNATGAIEEIGVSFKRSETDEGHEIRLTGADRSAVLLVSPMGQSAEISVVALNDFRA